MTNKRQQQHYVFVYGTLQRGFGNHGVIDNGHRSEFVGEATAKGQMWSVGGFPGCLFSSDAEGVIHGELYRITDESVMRNLDRLEGYRGPGHPNLYNRIELQLASSPVEIVEDDLVETYEWASETSYLTPVETGKWGRRAG